MTKTEKELAFLRELSIESDWTRRFTDLVDKHIDLGDSDNMLYINAGVGGHALSLDERFGEKTDIFASCENEDLLAIARDKAAALRSDVDFSTLRFEDEAFDAVLGDATFVRPTEVESFIENTVRVGRTGAEIAFFLPSAGSYGEIFSLMWEALFNADLSEHGAIVEQVIAELPPVWRLEEMAEKAGIVNINTQTAIELFEYESSAEFTASPLVEDFLMPMWLESLQETEKDRFSKELAQLIDVEDGTLTFRFSIKATMLTGEKG